MVCDGRRLAHTGGRSGRPKRAQRKSGNSCTHGIPAGLPWGMPGMDDEIEGAMQQAAQPVRHAKGSAVAIESTFISRQHAQGRA